MNKKVLFSALAMLSIFTSLEAEGAIWSSGESEVLTGNAQIDCVGLDCTLSPTDPLSPINERILIDRITGLNSFVMPASDESGNPYSLVGAGTSSSEGILQFDGFYGNYITLSGNITNTNQGYGVFLKDSYLENDFTMAGDVTSTNSYGVYLNFSTISGDMITSGDITANSQGLSLDYSTISGDMITSGDVTSTNSAGLYLYYSTISGDMITSGKVVAGSIDPDGTINATGDRAIVFEYGTKLEQNFSNSGIIASASEGIWIEKTRVQGDIINSGQILGGEVAYSGEETVGLYLVDMALKGNINNQVGGEISAEYGITLSSDYKDGTAGTYSATDLTVQNNGNIVGLNYDAIAFDITSEYTGTGGSYDNTLNYSGAGELNGALYDIDMGAGTDILNLTDVRGEWFSINGAETINASNYIIQSTYVDDATAMQAHTDATTTDFNFNNIGVLVDTAGTYTAGSEILVMSGAGAMTAEDISAFSIQFEGFAGTSGDFFLDGTDLKYRLNSVGEVGAKSDQASTFSTTPIAGASAGALASSMALNRNVERVVYQHAKTKTKENMELASLASDAIINSQKDFDPSGAWLQVFGETAEYDGKITNGVARSIAYESATNGVVVGYDKSLGNGLLLGSAFSYATSEVDGSADQFSTDITQYQLSIYGSFNYKRYFVDAQFGMGKSSYEQTREYVGNDVKSDFDGDSLSFGIGAGYVFNATERMTLSPYAKVNLVQSNQDAYVENGSFLSVAEVEMSSTQTSFGTEMNYVLFANNGTKWMPKLFVEYGQELGDEEGAINSQFIDTFANGTTGYAPELGESIIRVGTGLAILGSENGYNLSFDYKFETRERYTSHGLVLNGKLFF